MNRLKVKKFITEVENKDNLEKIINSILSEKGKYLFIAPMKAGKTTFTFKELSEALNEKGIQLIFISPKVTLLEQIKANHNIIKCYGKRGGAEIKEGIPVITTPDSLFKVINKCQELNKEFFMVYDEAHELELSYKFRKKLAYPIKYYEHNKCTGLLCMTATPDNIINSMEWNGTFIVDVEEKFIQAEQTNIITGFDNTVENIAKYIIDSHKKDDRTKVIRINDKNKIDEVATILKDTSNINAITWYRSREKDNEKGNTHLQAILEGAKLGNEIILTTSLVDVGVEIYSDIKPIVISFTDEHTMLIECIQFIGRFRDGVKEFNIISPSGTINESYKAYNAIQAERYQYYNELCVIANKYDIAEKSLIPNLKATQDQQGQYTYEVDCTAVNAEIFEKYIKQITKNPSLLRRYLKEHLTFNSNAIRIVKVNNIKNEEVSKMAEKLKEEKEQSKEVFKESVKAFRKKMEGFNNHQIELILKPQNELDLLTIHDKEAFKGIEEEYNFYHSEDMKEYRKRYYNLKERVKWSEEKKKLLLNILDDKWHKNFIKQWEYILVNRKFNEGFRVDPNNKLEQKVYIIRNTIKKVKGKENLVKLSDKFKGELLEALKENKCFAKLPPKSLTKHLNLIYTITDKSQITSAITQIKL